MQLIKREGMTARTPKRYFSIIDFIDLSFLDERLCRELVLGILHNTKASPPACPYCGYQFSEELWPRFFQNERMHCRDCRKIFTATTGTNINRLRLEFRAIVFLCILYEARVPLEEISRKIGISERNIRRLVDRFRLGRGV